MSGITPYLTIADGRARDAVAFYQDAFGAELVETHDADDGKRLMHAHLRLNGGELMLSDDFPEFHGGQSSAAPGGARLHLSVDDADAVWNRAVAVGAEVTMPLADDQFWGDRYGHIRDPFGQSWSIGAPIRKG
ncbi:VOC family protein [Sphingomonas cavernae]|uniref:VOC family protein n=1 Tax=Sphingomonas cavernae TaxID=2320861 RepID=A0A418WRD4_9SPHN|nr:VOC family protein [Sphingomonas cavernae]RJF93781.1 VOC family protein [Sphingomonas cavernae]